MHFVHNHSVKREVEGVRGPDFKSYPWGTLAEWPQISNLTSRCLSFLTDKIKGLGVLSKELSNSKSKILRLFTSDSTAAQRGEGTCPGSHRNEATILGLLTRIPGLFPEYNVTPHTNQENIRRALRPVICLSPFQVLKVAPNWIYPH